VLFECSKISTKDDCLIQNKSSMETASHVTKIHDFDAVDRDKAWH
jgi:hypothetical protein